MTKDIYQKVILACDQQTAFDYFTQSAQLEQWLAETADVEPMAGGKYELFWDKKNSTLGCRITTFEMPDKLSFDWKGPEQFRSVMNDENNLTQVSVSFLPLDEATTEIQLRHTGWQNDEQWEEARNWFDRVWERALKELAAVVKV